MREETSKKLTLKEVLPDLHLLHAFKDPNACRHICAGTNVEVAAAKTVLSPKISAHCKRQTVQQATLNTARAAHTQNRMLLAYSAANQAT